VPYGTYSSATAAAAAAGRHVVLELIPHQLPVHPPGGISYSGNTGLHGRGFGDQLVRPDKQKNFVKEYPFKENSASYLKISVADPDPNQDPDPIVKGMGPDPNPSIIIQL
jgi:hypothetical protein